jgi:hypothetical protein
MNNYNFGKYCIFDALNYLFCYCFLVKPCRDRCFTPWTIVKWVIYAGYFGALGVLVYMWREAKLEMLAEQNNYASLRRFEIEDIQEVT